MKHLKPFKVGNCTYEPVALDDGTLLVIHRDAIFNRICVVTMDDLFFYIASASGDSAAAILPPDTDVDAWIRQNFPGNGPHRVIMLYGRDATREWEGSEDEEGVTALELIDGIIDRTGGMLVAHEFSSEEALKAYHRGIADADGWEGMADFVDEYRNPFTEEEIAEIKRRTGEL